MNGSDAVIVSYMVRAAATAGAVFQDTKLAERWLAEPNPRLDGMVPLEACKTADGLKLVLEALMAIDHGQW